MPCGSGKHCNPSAVGLQTDMMDMQRIDEAGLKALLLQASRSHMGQVELVLLRQPFLHQTLEGLA